MHESRNAFVRGLLLIVRSSHALLCLLGKHPDSIHRLFPLHFQHQLGYLQSFAFQAGRREFFFPMVSGKPSAPSHIDETAILPPLANLRLFSVPEQVCLFQAAHLL